MLRWAVALYFLPVGSNSKAIATFHNFVVRGSDLFAQHNKVVQGCNQRLLPTEGRHRSPYEVGNYVTRGKNQQATATK